MNTEQERDLEATSMRAASETAVSVLVIGLAGCLVGIVIGVAIGWLIWG